MKKALIRYAALDMGFMLFITLVLEAVSLLVVKSGAQLFYVSMVMAVTLIVYMRWNAFGIIFAVAGGVIDALMINYANGTFTFEVLLPYLIVYGVGNAFTAIVMLFFKFLGKERLRDNAVYVVLYVLSAYIIAVLARCGIRLFFINGNYFILLRDEITHEALNVIFTAIILVIASRQKLFFVDQKEFFESRYDRR